ncbi:MAG: hypothetical protein Q9198_000394 [Flavoplaca austrocitrina]
MGLKDEHAAFEYIQWQPLYLEEKPYEIFMQIPEDLPHIRRTNLVFGRVHEQLVEDVRGREEQYRLNEHGFQVLRAPTSFADFASKEAVEDVYLPECIQLLKDNVEDVDRVFFFNWRLRNGDMSLQKKKFDLNNPTSTVVPAIYAHVDESFKGAYARVQEYMKGETEALLKGRLRLINIWRPLKPVEEWPLAFCDGRTVKRDDLIASDNIRSKYIGENLFAKYSPDYRWHYISDQKPDEVTLLKIFDSKDGVTKQTPHAAFKLSNPKPNPAFRESIEVRALVFTNPS